jgi:hypothetical protein
MWVDGHDEANTFGNFAKAPKNDSRMGRLENNMAASRNDDVTKE